MHIILLERVENLGTIGDVVNVKDGYARNFLLPQKKALRANESNRKVFEANRARLEKENAERRGNAELAGEKVAGAEVVLIRSASNSGQLYGSVNVRELAMALVAQGHQIDKRQVIMGAPIKTIGMFEVTVAMHPEVHVKVKANVAARMTKLRCNRKASTSWRKPSKMAAAKATASPKRSIRCVNWANCPAMTRMWAEVAAES